MDLKLVNCFKGFLEFMYEGCFFSYSPSSNKNNQLINRPKFEKKLQNSFQFFPGFTKLLVGNNDLLLVKLNIQENYSTFGKLSSELPKACLFCFYLCFLDLLHDDYKIACIFRKIFQNKQKWAKNDSLVELEI